MNARLSVFVMGVLIVLVGCGPPTATVEGPRPSTSASPTPPSAAVRALAALQASVADLGAVEVSGGAPEAIAAGTIRAAADLRTGEFRVVVQLDDGAGVLRMVRQSDLTWTTAPPRFWTDLGYTAESAREAQGKWVVARVEAIKPLVDSLDPGATVRALLGLGPEDVVGLETVRDGDLRGQRVLRFRQGGMEQAVYLTAGDNPRLLRISSASSTGTTVLNFLGFPERVRVRLPKPADVLPPG